MWTAVGQELVIKLISLAAGRSNILTQDFGTKEEPGVKAELKKELGVKAEVMKEVAANTSSKGGRSKGGRSKGERSKGGESSIKKESSEDDSQAAGDRSTGHRLGGVVKCVSVCMHQRCNYA